jgi:hypothetical protein
MQEPLLDRLRPDMDVCDADGAKVGTLARVHRAALAATGGAGEPASPWREDILEVKGGFLGLGARYYVPLSAVADVTVDCAFLDRAKDALEQLGWREKPPHID